MLKKYLLMVEDTASVAALYRSYLNPLGFDIDVVAKGGDAIVKIEERTPDLVLLDLRLPDMTGFEVLTEIRKNSKDIPVVLMTAHGSIDAAVEAMQLGAQDFLIKPCEADRLRVTVNNALRQAQKYQDEAKGSPNKTNKQYQGFIGSSSQMNKVYRTIDSAASSKATIFITGESGTGKEVCAEAIHAASKRYEGPFIAINCAAIPKDLIESELFGHVKGAFTGASVDRKGAAEQADGGTLFLDELCEMDLDLQTKLLRFIQTGTFQKVGSSKMSRVDVRFVCATNRDPWLEVQEGRFREDLYYRLHVIPLTLPPLRDRGNDIIEIAHSILGHFSNEEGREFITFSPEVTERFLHYDWPGNVRQLQNVIRNVVVLNRGKEVELSMLPPPLSIEPKIGSNIASVEDISSDLAAHNNTESALYSLSGDSRDGIVPLWQSEKKIIESAIVLCDGNIPQAAKCLEVSPSTLYRKLQSWNKK
ncbi:sigma-54 dependent transcriptional regulator [Aliivibrio sp. S4TY2]|uniref:quorum-sensing sigma-54 dependent transcriptional regulator LuxO n=1 Tax=unclassified Aliivibrio TaxID=2645654 RepID=UPI0023782AD2|nr:MULTISPECIES: quorum-sensing sigma-54 dependent transcriptional regulator LuxO [unclassified Aliivibrio]MDD9156603.1 sigma-54 dependent transcriptional regulator [Aliivibrio sp. S4TY2]MDD9159960.1 sigma-54 dependent transcriptional regulator [Aliivibrio sp. S4TY1]MDD9164182.1 sigma-54 dependent transcriptional regulator [Aliivibrio sp. S4MY2]MDD9168310.1 sigma-54 dependent transcriptional regulator [Aliivibrio sp. S4MY4]MDD9184646.1 sigma-54 dependent transcriptional regulator [Aliivibrio s